MAVDTKYQEVHPLTIAGERYGCHNRTMKPWYWAAGKWVTHAMSTDCRSFYLLDSDPRCAGCQTPRDTEYAERMQGMK